MSPKLQTFLNRLLSTVILIAVLAGVVLWNNPYGYATLICVLCNLTTFEWFRMLQGHAQVSNRWLILIAGIAYPWLLAWVTLFQPEALEDSISFFDNADVIITRFAFRGLLVYALIAFILELVRMDYRGQDAKNALQSLGTTLVAFIFPVWMFCFSLEALLSFPFNVNMLLYLVIVTKLSDIWAYVSGVLLGGKLIGQPFSPAVSPKKTWEGIIGSFILTSLCAWLLLPFSNVDIPAPLFFYLIMPVLFVLSVAGDLAGSLIKRGVGVKDSGSLLPGIGGIYDLVDSPAFTVSFCTGVFAIIGRMG